MKTTHAATKWHVITEKSEDYAYGINGFNAAGYPVRIANILHAPKAEAQANARLVSAAPELLEALKWFMANCDMEGPNEATLTKWTNTALAAIRKAEGND